MTSKSHLIPLSPVPAAKTRRGARTRQRLVEVAAAVFSDYGYSAARIADMVRMAGISHGNFYRHFPGKDEVLLAVLEEPLAELPRPETIDALGRVTGEAWYLILTGRSRLR
ncbi:MAG TPA: TetR/AcrR family transcriptional regulator [Acidimicrobiia bacterium]|nr:TetR/AcrR family transcriptional regulator [Acidimicrobiia bacterium]